EHFVAHDKADVAIVMFGANDRLDMRDPKLGYLHFQSDAWRDAYAAKVNGILEQEVAKYGGTFFPLWSVIVDDKGDFAAYGKDRNGVTERLRGDDGIHFTSAGYEVIADRLIPLL